MCYSKISLNLKAKDEADRGRRGSEHKVRRVYPNENKRMNVQAIRIDIVKVLNECPKATSIVVYYVVAQTTIEIKGLEIESAP